MSGDHAGHNHTHSMAKQTLRLAFFLSLIIVAAEVTGGLLAHSLALLSDAGHALTHDGQLSVRVDLPEQTNTPDRWRNHPSQL